MYILQTHKINHPIKLIQNNPLRRDLIHDIQNLVTKPLISIEY